MDITVLDWLEKTVKKIPNKIIYESLSKSMTFLELQEIAQRIGSAIGKYDISSNPVGVIMDKEVSTIATFLGVVYSGRAYAPIDVTLPEARIEKILSCLQPNMIITESKNIERTIQLCNNVGLDIMIVDVEDLWKADIDEKYLSDTRSQMVETDPLYVIFTSGSSGVPKGVITSHRSLMCYIDAYTDVMNISECDILGNQSPLDYIAAIRDIYVPIYKGASSVLIPKNYFMQMDKLAEIIERKKVTSLGWSTSAMVVMCSLGITDRESLGCVNKVCFSGSVMPGSVLNKWQALLPKAKFVNQYGPTEATASCTYYVIDHFVSDDEIIPIGRPYRNYKVFLIKDDQTEADIGEEGEICVSGPILAMGYYNNLEKTKCDFIQNPLHCTYEERIYKTGDIGVVDNDGLLYFRGRKDRQIKHMGHRVELDEIEVACSSINDIDECSVVYNKEKETIYLFYVGKATVKDISIALRKQLPGFMVPRKIQQLDSLPKLPNSKINLTSLNNMTQ